MSVFEFLVLFLLLILVLIGVKMTVLQDKIAELTAAAAEDASVTSSGVTVIAGLLKAVQDGVDAQDLAAIQAALDAFKQNTQTLATAIATVPPAP